MPCPVHCPSPLALCLLLSPLATRSHVQTTAMPLQTAPKGHYCVVVTHGPTHGGPGGQEPGPRLPSAAYNTWPWPRSAAVARRRTSLATRWTPAERWWLRPVGTQQCDGASDGGSDTGRALPHRQYDLGVTHRKRERCAQSAAGTLESGGGERGQVEGGGGVLVGLQTQNGPKLVSCMKFVFPYEETPGGVMGWGCAQC